MPEPHGAFRPMGAQTSAEPPALQSVLVLTVGRGSRAIYLDAEMGTNIRPFRIENSDYEGNFNSQVELK